MEMMDGQAEIVTGSRERLLIPLAFTAVPGTPSHHARLGGGAGLPERMDRGLPGARNFIEAQFACGEAGFANGHGWCDGTLDDRMDEAAALQVTDPGAANRA